jgi:hypothetical protein
MPLGNAAHREAVHWFGGADRAGRSSAAAAASSVPFTAQLRQLLFFEQTAAICALMSTRPKHSDTLVNPAAALGDEALGKRGEGCRASPLLR